MPKQISYSRPGDQIVNAVTNPSRLAQKEKVKTNLFSCNLKNLILYWIKFSSVKVNSK